jgi:hypothetical protein
LLRTNQPTDGTGGSDNAQAGTAAASLPPSSSRAELISKAIESAKTAPQDASEDWPVDDVEELEAEGTATPKPKPKVTPKKEAPSGEAATKGDGEPALETPAQKKAWAAVLERENVLRTEREAAKREREELLSLRDKMSSQIEEVRSREERFREELRKDPLGVLQREAGIDYDSLTARVIGDKPDPLRAVEDAKREASSEIVALREEIKRLSDRLEEGEREKYRSDYRGSIKRALESDDYSILRAKPNAEDIVFELASRYAAEHGELLTAHDAAARIQDEFREELGRMAKVESVASYLREILSGSQEPPESKQQQAPEPTRRGIQTTRQEENVDLPRAPRGPRRIDGTMTREEAIAEAIRRVRG